MNRFCHKLESCAINLFELAHENLVFIVYGSSEDLEEPAQMLGLAGAFTARTHRVGHCEYLFKEWLCIPWAEPEGGGIIGGYRFLQKYSKICVKLPLKMDKTKILMTNGSLMKVKSIAECFPWSILQYF